ncbi:hypothetical protein MML48_4g00006293 [Holotrichia oblita]|uniref:Uncharacterized protein n=1 Tax=Holotrichia oblita TaxID=644536 RepID=A0ACB9T6V6_HOLOL|nr:hypothetical protein MML48_4g00006293 [Holotrichia oblita]
MQSEEIEESASPLELPSSKSEMTYSDNVTDSTSPANSTQNEDNIKNYQQDNDLSENDPKMVPDSPTSAENGEDNFKIEPTEKQAAVNTTDIQTREPERKTSPSSSEQQSNESIRNWLQRITQMQTEIQRKLSSEQTSSPNLAFTEFPMKSSVSSSSSSAQNSTSSRVVKYQDLPYMGEMTLDNSKPRRGRKPKKADICHLIYKNYGTIYPGTPNPKSLVDRETPKKAIEGKFRESPIISESLHRSDVQNKIISSLLERRLTQESKRHREALISSPISSKAAQRSPSDPNQNEPLNLCIRDLNQLKIRLLRKTDNIYSSENAVEVKSEPPSDDDVEFIHETPSPSSTSSKELKFPNLVPDSPSGVSTPGEGVRTPENGAPGGYVYWPNAGIFIHPMALQQHLMYYQKMAANNNYTLPSNSNRIPIEANHANLEATTTELRKLAPKVKPKKPESTEDDSSSTEPKVKRNASGSSDKTPTKRKRSAIFIPPIPTENQTNPATEVSICKFKFTGGAKPSLQEKKMLSVDSGGNFRYYNGTGDKSMRGYEFFPRETLQQQINAQGSSTGAFLQASGEKIFPTSPGEFPGKPPHDFMLAPELQSQSLSATPDLNARHKKRKSRKSLQREKLEQTFKEKGFLIQTQQLESAEGATYCKFRQLRKFTRYLFRSWKDYLPGISNEEERTRENEEIENEADLENLSTLSNSDLTSSDLRE